MIARHSNLFLKRSRDKHWKQRPSFGRREVYIYNGSHHKMAPVCAFTDCTPEGPFITSLVVPSRASCPEAPRNPADSPRNTGIGTIDPFLFASAMTGKCPLWSNCRSHSAKGEWGVVKQCTEIVCCTWYMFLFRLFCFLIYATLKHLELSAPPLPPWQREKKMLLRETSLESRTAR